MPNRLETTMGDGYSVFNYQDEFEPQHLRRERETQAKRQQNILLSSAKDNWETPQAFFDRLNKIYHFGLDAAAERCNAKCPVFIDKETDAFAVNWGEYARSRGVNGPVNVFLNPPYGRGKTVERWIRRAYEQSMQPGVDRVVCLAAARTDTKWFHEIALKHAAGITFIKGRLTFEVDGKPAANSGTFPSVLIEFREFASQQFYTMIAK